MTSVESPLPSSVTGAGAASAASSPPGTDAPSAPSPRPPWQPWTPPQPPPPPKPNISDLAISNHVGPEMDLPPTYLSKTIDEQITDAKMRLENRNDPANLSVPYKVKPYNKAMLQGLHANMAVERDRILSTLTDSRYKELQRFNEALDREEALSFEGPPWLVQWQEDFRSHFKKLEGLIRTSSSSQTMSRQLEGTYAWFKAGLASMTDASVIAGGHNPKRNMKSLGPHFFELGPEELSADGMLPGSAYYNPPRDGDELDTGSQQQSLNVHNSLPAGRDDIPPQPPVAQLPSARERLRQVKTKQVAEPVNGRPSSTLGFFRDAASPTWGSQDGDRSAAPSPDCLDRPFTPSTMYGGSTAGRTASSARSTPSPMPLVSRPASAASGYRRPLTASGARGPEVIAQRSLLSGLPPRPGTSLGITTGGAIPEHRGVGWGTSAPSASARSPSASYPVEPWKTEKEPMTEAELRMEERWLQYRQKDIADTLMAEERKAMLREWAERRARVEEEIARNAETSRYQSELRRRGYGLPEDTHVDVEASVTAPSKRAQPQSARGPREKGSEANAAVKLAPEVVASGSATAAVRRQRAAEVPRFDVSKSGGKQGTVRFSWDGGLNAAKPKPPAISSRAAYLRRVHKRLLDPPPEAFQTTSAASNAAALRAAALAADAEKAAQEEAEEAEAEADDDNSEHDSQAEGSTGKGPGSEEDEDAEKPVVDEEIRPEVEPDDDEAEVGNVFATAEGVGYLSLSPYTFDRDDEEMYGDDRMPLRRPDDSDVLATVCKHWWRHHGLTEEDLKPVGLETGLEELRFRQLQEAEAIKRVFARRNRPVDAGVLDRALVMPVHRITGAGANMSAACSGLPSNPFFKPLTKTKKKKKKGGKGKKKK